MIDMIETNAFQTEKGIFLEMADHYFIIEMSVACDGYYEVELAYQHNDWEAYLNLEITRSDGEVAKLLVGLPHGKRKISHSLFLRKGKNILYFKHRFSLGMHILDIKNKGKVEQLPHEISPQNVSLFLERYKTLKTYIRNYRDELVKIETDTGIDVPFEMQEGIEGKRSSNEFIQTMITVWPETNVLWELGKGIHTLYYHFTSGKILEQKLTVRKNIPKTRLQVAHFDIGQANATLFCLPNGKKLLVDSGTESAAREKLIPWFEKESIKIDYYLLTHFHNDHNGCRDEIIKANHLSVPDAEVAAQMIKAEKELRYDYLKNFDYLDSTMLCYYDELHKIWDLGGVKAEVLNSRFDENGDAAEVYLYPFMKRNEHNYENATSVSFMLVYNDFRYYHGADNYAYIQERYMSDMIKAKKTEELQCDFFYANHHFVCDISPTFINTLNPVVVFVTNEYIYHRTMYTKCYKENVQDFYYAEKRLQDTLITEEVGNVVLGVNSSDDWYYETIQDEDLMRIDN